MIGVFFELGPDSLGKCTEGGWGKDSGGPTEKEVEEGHCVDRLWAGGVSQLFFRSGGRGLTRCCTQISNHLQRMVW